MPLGRRAAPPALLALAAAVSALALTGAAGCAGPGPVDGGGSDDVADAGDATPVADADAGDDDDAGRAPDAGEDVGDGGDLEDAGETDGDAGAEDDGGGSADGGDGAPFTHRVDAILFREVLACAVGNPCTGATCIGLRDDDGALVATFADDGAFRALPPSDPSLAAQPESACMRLVLSDDETARLRGELRRFADDVAEDTQGALRLDLAIHEVVSVELSMTRWGDGLWIGPWDLAPVVAGLVTTATDFTLVTHAVRDPDTGLHHDLGGCGGTLAADWGVAGAGHSWIPSTGNAFWFECADHGVYGHEWLHQVDWALHELSAYDDAYDDAYPQCGVDDVDPRAWFPDTHDCARDPDFANCGAADCGGNDVVNEHVLSAHWPTGTTLVANRCRDGVQDFDETGVDEGGACAE